MKRLLKRCLIGACAVCSLPAYLLYQVGCLIVPRERSFEGWSQAYALVPGIAGEWLRAGFYRLTLEQWGTDCQIQFGTILSRPQVRLHDGVSIGPYCALGMVEIGENTIVGTGVQIPSGAHQHGTERLDTPIKHQGGRLIRVTIGQDCWLGNGCIVLADVGNHCVIGAGSVVTSPIPDFAVALGVPARVLRNRNAPPLPDEKV